MPFSKDNRPKLPDSYFNFAAAAANIVPPSPGSTVAIPLVNNWGPFKEPKLITSFAQYQQLFGYSETSPGYVAVKGAFVGEGLDGRGGAGAVLVYRFGGSAAAKASKQLTNAKESPESAIKLTGKYVGTKGNDLRVTVRASVTNVANQELVLLDGTTELELYTFEATNVNSLGEQINRRSNWITAEVQKTGTKLTAVTATALTGGNDGETLLAEDWTKALNALAVEPFGILAPYNLTDPSITLALDVFIETLNLQKGKRFMGVVGGALGEELTTAETRSENISDPEVVNFGVGKYLCAGMGPNGAALEMSPAQMAPRIAGILAAKGEYAALTYARLAGVTILSGPTDAEIARAYDAGVLVLARDEDPDAETYIKVGHNTWTEKNAAGELNSKGEPVRPYFIFREPKYVRTMHGIQTDLSAYFRREILGLRPVNDDTRDAVVSEAKLILTERERLGVIQPGWTVGVDQNPPPSDDDEFVALVMGLKFGRVLKQTYVTITVG